MTHSLPLLDGLPDVLGALTADLHGQLRAATSPGMAGRNAAAAAASLDCFVAAGSAAGLTRLRFLCVKGGDEATITAMRSDELLLAVAPSKGGTTQVEKALLAWASSDGADGATSPAAGSSGPRAVPPPPAASTVASDAARAGSPAATPPRGAAASPPRVTPLSADRARPMPTPTPTPAPAPAAATCGPTRLDPWADLRRTLVRGLLTEAAARRRDLDDSSAATGRPGAEPVAAAELDRAMQLLLQGIGSVLAGDGLGGARTLEPLAGDAQPNLSLRWLALHWSGRAALMSGDSAAARRHLKLALTLAKSLGLEALSATQWIAAEVLAHDGDSARALGFLAQARGGFQRLGNRWGHAQAWLAEARVLVSLGRDDEGVEAARQAWAAEPSWDEPPVFLARRALARNDLDEAEEMLRSAGGPAAERVRSLVDAMREQIVSAADAGEFLRESDGPPSARAIRTLERIANVSPRFLQAREALAWMLLKTGRYAEASVLFRGLLAQQLTPADRASVMLGLGCIAHAQHTGKSPDVRLHAAVAAAGATPTPAPGVAAATPPLPPIPASALPGRSSQIASSSAVFSGQLSVFPLPDVVEFVRSARRTGLLVCSSASGMAAVHFKDGRITGTASPGTPRLGELLVGARKISNVALRAVTSARRADEPDHLLGEELIREGVVDAAAVEEALRRQAEATLLEIVRWRDGEFAFNREGDGEAASAGHAVEFDAQDVLLNVIRQMDEDGRSRSGSAVQR
jgi:tetratricopeptide (TPR) repeat protein